MLTDHIESSLRSLAVPIGDVFPDPANVRRHPERNLAAIVNSLRAFGQQRPILCDAKGKIVAGNGTYAAAKQLGWESIAVTRTMLEGAQAAAYAIADNRSAILAEWDDEALRTTLDALAADVPLDVMGWTDEEFKADFPLDPFQGETDPDDIPEQPPPVCKRGDLWLLGEHRLLCGDSTVAEDVAKVMGGERADIVITSPPYNQDIGNFSKSGMHKETKWVDQTRAGAYPDNLPEDEYESRQAFAIELWKGFLTETASIFYNHKNRFRGKQCISPWRWIDKTSAKVRQEIVWLREGSVTQNMRGFMPCDERIFWMYFGNDFTWNESTEHKTWSTVWRINSHKDRGVSIHGCQFPVELPSRAIMACTAEKMIVLEPYCGSGTTIIAAEQLHRRCFAIEISPAYCDVAIKRWELFTGKKATLAESA